MKNEFYSIENVEESDVSKSDIDEFNKLVDEFQRDLEYLVGVTAPYLGMDKRIIQIDSLTLVNPVIVERSNPLVYIENDQNKPKKYRKVLRYSHIKVKTDNVGEVEFKSDKEDWKGMDELINDVGLMEACLVQRLVDSINGISNSSPKRRYDTAEKSTKIPRNQKVMMQNENGDMIFIKYKLSNTYTSKGYTLL
jgi:hypothetical protein